jgi:hypothetical protein
MKTNLNIVNDVSYKHEKYKYKILYVTVHKNNKF